MKFWVGTSGFSYKPWLGNFYPERLPAKGHVAILCVAADHGRDQQYFLPAAKESVVKNWASQVGPDFRFVLKAPQRITHIKRLKEARSGSRLFLSRRGGIGKQSRCLSVSAAAEFEGRS
jgi:uncharacterized protein YecE (DUF72 family)